jgi:hypothetical protein
VAYQTIDNFAFGLDTRKSPLTSPSGTLTRLRNAVITPGGEIAKRKAFVKVADVPGSFGLAATSAKLVVFGRNVKPTVPPTIAGVPMVSLLVPNANLPATGQVQTDFDIFDGKVYLAAHEPNVAFRHYYENVVGGPMVETQGTHKGPYIRTYQAKMYAVLGSNISFSAVRDPMTWTSPDSPANGAGTINLAMQDADLENLTSLEIYYNKMAVFASEATQIWAVDPDPLQNVYEQLLRGAGTIAPRSPLQYGSGDILYLDQSGIRSLKARDSSNSASVSDIGSPIDSTIQQLLLDRGSTYMSQAVSLLEPSVGRFWMVFPDQIFALSYFPGPKITAWSQFDTGFSVQHAVSCAGRMFFRDNNDGIWVYGGVNNLTHDNCHVEVRLPYLDGKKPGHRKLFQGLDATVSGVWRIAISFDFNNPEAEETLCTIDRPTWNAGRAEAQGYDSHFSLRLYNDDTEQATISNVAVHYEMADAET